MKIKINLRHINDLDKTSSTQERSKTSSISSQCDDKLIFLDYSKKDSVLYLKIEIGKRINETPDSIELWHKDNDKSVLVELNDIDSISVTIEPNKNNNRLIHNTLEKVNKDSGEDFIAEAIDEKEDAIVYYKVNLYPLYIIVDFYQNKIEKIRQTLSSSCSILMLKHKIEEKFIKDSNMIKANQKIFGIALKNKTQVIEIKMEGSKEYDNKTKLSWIIKENELKQKVLFGSLDLIHLNLLLVLNMKDTTKMGLNFNFNYFKNLSQVNFNKNAPTYRECSDGLNMFVYCRNSQCELYNEMFVRNLGYGCFDIIRETLRTKCPHCRSNSLAEVRNIGMINATWVYSGLLNSKKDSCFEGDGTTIINNRLYLLSEIKISNVFSKLLIKTKPRKSKNDRIETESKKNKGEMNEDASSLFDSIPLCLNKKNNISSKNNNKNKDNEVFYNASDVNESVVINNTDYHISKKRINSEVNGRIIKTDLDDKGAYCMNGCLIPNKEPSKSSEAKCAIF